MSPYNMKRHLVCKDLVTRDDGLAGMQLRRFLSIIIYLLFHWKNLSSFVSRLFYMASLRNAYRTARQCQNNKLFDAYSVRGYGSVINSCKHDFATLALYTFAAALAFDALWASFAGLKNESASSFALFALRKSYYIFPRKILTLKKKVL